MTADGRAALIVAVVSLFGTATIAMCAWVLRTLWAASVDLAAERQSRQANTAALGKLSDAVDKLTDRVSNVEGRLADSRRR
jgi:hypothetical protein